MSSEYNNFTGYSDDNQAVPGVDDVNPTNDEAISAHKEEDLVITSQGKLTGQVEEEEEEKFDQMNSDSTSNHLPLEQEYGHAISGNIIKENNIVIDEDKNSNNEGTSEFYDPDHLTADKNYKNSLHGHSINIKNCINYKKRTVFGLNNYGNTCYINSVLQILINSQDFVSNLVEAKSDIGRYIRELYLSNEKNRDMHLQNLLCVAHTIDKRWADSQQRDSKDFFLSILTSMLNLGDENATRVFYGVKTSIYTMACSHKLNVEQNFGFLNAGKQTIQNYFENAISRFIDAYKNNQILDFFCEKHNIIEMCTEERFVKLPKILGIYFDNENKQNLNLKQYKTVKTSQHELELCGVIQRLGYGSNSGHYRAFYFFEDICMKFDDSFVDRYEKQYIESAYMIFYKILS